MKKHRIANLVIALIMVGIASSCCDNEGNNILNSNISTTANQQTDHQVSFKKVVAEDGQGRKSILYFFEIDGCEYIEDNGTLTHKANCKNPIHW